jgi:hypothetical protein
MMAKAYVVAHSAVGTRLQGELVTAEQFKADHEGVDDARLDELVKRGALREATDAEIQAGSAVHSDRDATFVEDQAADEMRALIRELQERVALLEGGDKKATQAKIDDLAQATADRDKAVQAQGDQIVADALGQPAPKDKGK